MEDYESTYAANVERQKGSNAYTEYCLNSINQRRAMVHVDNKPGSGEEKFIALRDELTLMGCKSALYYSMLRFHLGLMQSGDLSQERREWVCYSANLFKDLCNKWLNQADNLEYQLQENQGCIGRFREFMYTVIPPYYLANVEMPEYANHVRSPSLVYFSYMVEEIEDLVLHLAGENMRLQLPIKPEVLSSSISIIDDSFVLDCLGIDLNYPDFIGELVAECPKG